MISIVPCMAHAARRAWLRTLLGDLLPWQSELMARIVQCTKHEADSYVMQENDDTSFLLSEGLLYLVDDEPPSVRPVSEIRDMF
jgi:hypothetical protein